MGDFVGLVLEVRVLFEFGEKIRFFIEPVSPFGGIEVFHVIIKDLLLDVSEDHLTFVSFCVRLIFWLNSHPVELLGDDFFGVIFKRFVAFLEM